MLNKTATAYVVAPLFIMTLWPSLATQAKRWHDLDYSAWMILVNAIPFVGPLWAFVANWFLRGTEGPNSFGQDPYGVDADVT